MGYDVSPWNDFFVAFAGAGAALAGLLFVAVSINVERIVAYPGLPDRALATLLLLVGVIVASAFGLAPGQSRAVVGVELLAVGVATALPVAVTTVRAHRRDTAAHSTLVPNLVVMLGGTLPFAVGGASLLAGAGGGLYWVLAGAVVAIVGALVNAWVLLIEILR